MFSVDEYIGSIKTNLEKQSDVLVENLREVLGYNFSSDVALLDFSASIEPTRFELSVTMFSMDKEANEVFSEDNDPAVFAGSAEVLPEIEYHQLNGSELDDFFDFYENNEEIVFPKEQATFTAWFSQCWKKAGGANCDLPAYFIFDDESKSYDLKNARWIDDDEK